MPGHLIKAASYLCGQQWCLKHYEFKSMGFSAEGDTKPEAQKRLEEMFKRVEGGLAIEEFSKGWDDMEVEVLKLGPSPTYEMIISLVSLYKYPEL